MIYYFYLLFILWFLFYDGDNHNKFFSFHCVINKFMIEIKTKKIISCFSRYDHIFFFFLGSFAENRGKNILKRTLKYIYGINWHQMITKLSVCLNWKYSCKKWPTERMNFFFLFIFNYKSISGKWQQLARAKSNQKV